MKQREAITRAPNEEEVRQGVGKIMSVSAQYEELFGEFEAVNPQIRTSFFTQDLVLLTDPKACV